MSFFFEYWTHCNLIYVYYLLYCYSRHHNNNVFKILTLHGFSFPRVPHSTWKTCNFVIYFCRTEKFLEFAQKMEFNSKHFEETFLNTKFGVSRLTFQDVIYKKKNFIYIFVVSTLSIQTQIRSQI